MKLVVAVVVFILWSAEWSANSQEEEEGTQRPPHELRVRPARRGAHRSTPTNRQNATSHGENIPKETSNDDEMLGQAVSLLQRLNDRLAGLQALDEQQIRRLETLEYRLTKLEVQQQEKAESLRTELREVARRAQQQDWQTSKMDAMMEALKLDVAGIAQGQDHIRGLLSVPETRYPTLGESDMKNKLQNLIGVQLMLKGAIGALNEGIARVGHNVTQLLNITQAMFDMNNKLVTKQHLKNIMLDFQSNVIWSARSEPKTPAHEATEQLPSDCSALKDKHLNQSGVYKIQPPQAPKPFYAYCDMETLGGGWTIIQNRYEGTVDFNRGWEDYKHGFGNLAGEFWIGLQKMHLLTNYKVQELYIELTDFSFTKTFARYTAFAIGEEIEGYPIQLLGGYDGDAGDSLVYHAGMKFSTYDMDNDAWNDGNCAESHTGAWWYNGCDTSNLNGRYLGGELVEDYEYQGMYWYDWHGPLYSLMRTRMAIRPSKQPNDNMDGFKPHTEEAMSHRNHTKQLSQKETRAVGKNAPRQNAPLQTSEQLDYNTEK